MASTLTACPTFLKRPSLLITARRVSCRFCRLWRACRRRRRGCTPGYVPTHAAEGLAVVRQPLLLQSPGAMDASIILGQLGRRVASTLPTPI